MGTGAFTSVSANRDVTIDVADDSSAFLSLSAPDSLENSAYVEEITDGTLAIDISGASEREGQDGSEGLNRDATTTFLQLFQVENQGSNTVGVRIPLLGTDIHDDFGPMGFFVGDSHNANSNATSAGKNTDNTVSFTKVKNYNFDNPSEDLRVLTPGDSVIIGAFLTTDGDESDTNEYSITVRAENEDSAIAGDR